MKSSPALKPVELPVTLEGAWALVFTRRLPEDTDLDLNPPKFPEPPPILVFFTLGSEDEDEEEIG